MTINLLREGADHRARTGFWAANPGTGHAVFVKVRSDNQRRPYFWLDYMLPAAGRKPSGLPGLGAAVTSYNGERVHPLDRARKVQAYHYQAAR